MHAEAAGGALQSPNNASNKTPDSDLFDVAEEMSRIQGRNKKEKFKICIPSIMENEGSLADKMEELEALIRNELIMVRQSLQTEGPQRLLTGSVSLSFCMLDVKLRASALIELTVLLTNTV